MKVLITGASGFIGKHLCEYLRKRNVDVYALVRKSDIELHHATLIRANILDRKEVEKVITEILPDVIYHLAAQSLVIPSWKNPEETFNINIDPTVFILETLRKSKFHCRLIIIGSSSEYASSDKEILETDTLEPNSPYGLSKIVQDYLGFLYTKAYDLDIVRVRPFYIIGPGKENDSISDFSKGIVAIEKGKQDNLCVGNLEAYRDYLDINDFLDALLVVTEKGQRGNVYNISSGSGHQVKKVLDMLVSLSNTSISIIVDKAKFRPIDEPKKIGNNRKLQDLEWLPKVAMRDSLQRILNYWRKQDSL